MNRKTSFYVGWISLLSLLAIPFVPSPAAPPVREPTPEAVLAGVKQFLQKTARPDGSFRPGMDPDYRGMSDSAYSDLAPITYAVIVSRTFGWELPYQEKTKQFLLARQRESGEFVNLTGTVDPNSAAGRAYNTTMALMALRALEAKPRHDPLSVFASVLREDYKKLPLYMTSFFPLAYLCAGKPIPPDADRKIKALMVQDEDDGYIHDHVASTFHAVHYYRLIGEKTPKGEKILARVLRDQKSDGSWMLNMPSRDRHATFDAAFILRQLDKGPDGRKALDKAAKWALSCRNDDGGFGHFPGSPSDADAVYFQIATLVVAGYLEPARVLPKDRRLAGWGHLFPIP